MASHVSGSNQDRAIEGADDDALDRGPFVDSLIRAVVHTERDLRGRVTGRRSTGFVVGLTGEWGLGKSSVLNLVKEQLESFDHVAVASINPWLFKNRDDLIKAYFTSLRDAIGKTLRERARDILVQLEKYKGAIDTGGTIVAAVIDGYGGLGAASGSWKLWGRPAVRKLPKPAELSPDDERKSLEAKLKQQKIAVVVLIDELDRVEDDEVLAVAQLIKAVGDIKGISYLVAYDPKRVVQALGRGSSVEERASSGEAYLEKIVQFAVPLRPLFEEDTRALLASALQDSGVELPAAHTGYQAEIINELIRVVRTPREIKRLAGAFAVLEQIIHGELCLYDVLGYSWIATKAPGVRDAIARNSDGMVSDPGDVELLRRLTVRRENGRKQESIEDLLGIAARPHEQMLKLLFNRFGEQEQEVAGDRLAKRRNLVRLLYLGNPPKMMSRSQIDSIWALESIERTEVALRNILNDGGLAGLLDRVGDILHHISSKNDKFFWPALARTLMRQHDWITEQEVLGSIVDDAGQLLWRFGRQGVSHATRVKEIIASLIADNDLLITPWLIRKHLFAHGLTVHKSEAGGDAVFTKVETKEYLEAELPRYTHAIKDGTFLRRLPDTEAVFVVLNARRWTEELRTNLTEQLSGIRQIATFAALTVKPGYIADQKTMDEMLDGEAILRRLIMLAKNGELPDDPWLRASVTRLAATLRGHDPHFIRDYADDNYIVNGVPTENAEEDE